MSLQCCSKNSDISIGQLFIAGIPGTSVDKLTDALIHYCGIGGIVLFSRNIENPVQVASLCRDLQQRAMSYHGIPLFIAVDQEGGRVARLKRPFTVFPGNRAIGKDPRPMERAKEFACTTARELSLVGINMDFAPVLDVCGDHCDAHLEGRSFSSNPQKVARLGRIVIRYLQQNGIMAVAKHFPGLGRARLDPHEDLPTIEVSEEEMEQTDLVPFMGAIEEGVSGIMVSHALYPSIDAGMPGTVSWKLVTGLLRRRLAYDGLIITDDLEMGAIRKWLGTAQGAVASFEAGSDILLICSEQDQVLEAIGLIKKKMLKGKIPESRLYQSLERIERAKKQYLNNSTLVRLN